MSWQVMIAGFTLGAAGSLHCVGMCGPLSLALPVYHLPASQKFISLLLYQSGRIITYSIIGLAAGLAGHRIYIAGYQQWFSIIMGSIVLLAAILYFLKQWSPRFYFVNNMYMPVQRMIGRLLRSPVNKLSFLLIGMANGLLPCGMVYIALATTFSFIHARESVLFMAMFGAGTLPAMMAVAYAGQLFTPSLRISFRKVIPYITLLAGIVLVLRGLNLGIPFISPVLPAAPGQAVVCHP